jgi:hypothetical protein
VLIGTDGRVQAVAEGEVPLANMASTLDASLAGKTPDPKMGMKTQ